MISLAREIREVLVEFVRTFGAFVLFFVAQRMASIEASQLHDNRIASKHSRLSRILRFAFGRF